MHKPAAVRGVPDPAEPHAAPCGTRWHQGAHGPGAAQTLGQELRVRGWEGDGELQVGWRPLAARCREGPALTPPANATGAFWLFAQPLLPPPEEVAVVTGPVSALCFSTIPIAERFFTSSPSLTLKHAAWYPCETLEPHIVLLTSDNTIR